MTMRCLVDILPVKPFYLYILSMKAKLVSLPNFMIVWFVSSAPACTIPARDTDPDMLKNERLIPKQCNYGSTDRTVNIVYYKQHDRCNEKVDCHNFVKHLDENSHTDWQ